MQKITLYSSAYGSYSLPVVGEESYQHEIKQVIAFDDENVNRFREDGFTAELILEDNNTHDLGNAVRVDIDDMTVGYLSRVDAKKYREGLAKNNIKNATGKCYAAIAGKYNEKKEDMLFGVWLDLNVDNLVIISQSAIEKPKVKKTQPKSENINARILLIIVIALFALGVIGIIADQVSLFLENTGRLPTRTPTLVPTLNMFEVYKLTQTAINELVRTPTP